MAVDVGELPPVDPDSASRFYEKRLGEYAQSKIMPPVPAVDSTSPVAPASAESPLPEAPVPQTTVATPQDQTAELPATPTPQAEAAPEPPATVTPSADTSLPIPSWLPDQAKTALEAHAKAPSATQDPAKADVLAIGAKQIGKPYAGPIVGQSEAARWGSVGWDCSSFVSGVYAQLGVKLPAFTDAIASSTQLVKPGDERPGDIILYKYRDSYQPGVAYPHTGLLVGNGKMLDASYGAGVGIHPMLNQPYEIRRPVGITPDGSTLALQNGAVAGKIPDLAPKLDLPPVDPASAARVGARSLHDYAAQKIDDLKGTVQEAPQSFMDFVGSKLDGLQKALPDVTGFKPDVPIEQQDPFQARPGTVASQMPPLPGVAGPPTPDQLAAAQAVHPDLTTPQGIHEFSGAVGEAAGGAIHAGLPEPVRELPAVEGAIKLAVNPEFAPGSAPGELVGVATGAAFKALSPAMQLAARGIDSALVARGVDMSVLSPALKDQAVAYLAQQGIDASTIANLSDNAIGSVVTKAIETAQKNGVGVGDIATNAGMGAGAGAMAVRENDPNAGPLEIGGGMVAGALLGGGAAIRGATIGAGIKAVKGFAPSEWVHYTTPETAALIKGQGFKVGTEEGIGGDVLGPGVYLGRDGGPLMEQMASYLSDAGKRIETLPVHLPSDLKVFDATELNPADSFRAAKRPDLLAQYQQALAGASRYAQPEAIAADVVRRNGFDAYRAGEQMVVFNPSRVMASAAARVGKGTPLAESIRASDPELARIVDAFSGAPPKRSASEYVKAAGDWLQREFVDEGAAVNALGAEAEAARANYAGRAASAWQFVEDKLGPVFDILGVNKGKNQEVLNGMDSYVGLQRYLEVAREKGSPIGGVDSMGNAVYRRDGPGGLTTTAQAVDALGRLADKVGPENMAKIIRADKVRQEAMHDMLTEKVRSGFLDQKTADELEAKYPHYNPVTVLQAIKEAQGTGPITGNKLTQIGNTIKRLTEDGSEADQLPAMQSAALALAEGRTNVMRNDAVKTIVRAAKVPVERALEYVRGVDTSVGKRSFETAKAWITPGQSDRIAEIQDKLANTVMGRKTERQMRDEIRSIMSGSSLNKTGTQTVDVIDGDLLKYAPHETATFRRSPGAGGSSLTPANYGSVERNTTLGRNAPDANPLTSVITSLRDDPRGKVSYWENGKRYVADFSAMPEVERSLKSMDRTQLPLFVNLAQVMNAPLRAGATTLSIPFQLRNAFFDAVDAYARLGIKPWGENGIIRGYVDAATKSAEYKKWIEQGGGMGGLFTSQPTIKEVFRDIRGKSADAAAMGAQYERELRASGGIKVENPGDVMRLAKQFGLDLVTFKPLRRAGEIIEQGPRMAAYRQSLASGAGEVTATMAGRRVTVDFSRMGTAMRYLNALIPFSNAALQGSLNMGRSLGIGQRAGLLGDSGSRMTAVRYAALTAAVASTYAWNRQFGDRYQDVPEYVRANSLVIMLPGGERNTPGTPGWKSNPYIAMPLREIGALPYLITKALEKMDGQDPDFGGALQHALQSASPIPDVMTPSGILGAPGKAIVEQQIGTGGWDRFRGRPIVSERLLGKQPGKQATLQTSPTAIDMAALINRSPAQAVMGEQSPVRVQRFIEDTTGGMGKTVLEAADTLSGKPADTPPVVGGALSGIYKSYGGETEQRMYDQQESLVHSQNAQYRDLLETLDTNGASLGQMPKEVDDIPLLPQEQAQYRGFQLEYLKKFFAEHPQIDARLSAIPTDRPELIQVRAELLKDFVDTANGYAEGMILKQLGTAEIRQRLQGAATPEQKSPYPQKQYEPVGGK